MLFPLWILYLLTRPYAAQGQTRQHEPPYLRSYRQAEKYYASDKATHHTDSLALDGYKQTIFLLEKQTINSPERTRADDSLLFDSYLKSGILDMSGGKPRQAIVDFMGSARLIRQSGSGLPEHLPDSLLFKPYLYAGSCYYDLYDLDSALYFYKLAERLVETNPGLSESERLYNKSGALYYETGDYRRSIQYFSKALALVETRNAVNPRVAANPNNPAAIYFIVNYKNNIATSLRKLQEYDQAIDLYKSLLPFHINEDELLHNIGASYLDAGRPAEAIQYLQRVRYNSQVKYNHLARAWLDLKNYPAATTNLLSAMTEYGKSSAQTKGQDLSITLKYFGDLSMAKSDPRRALGYYQRAMIQADRDFNDTAIGHNPTAYYGLHNSFLLFDILIAKAAAFQILARAVAQNNGASAGPTSHSALVSAFAAYTSALGLARHVERMYNSDEAKLFLVKKVDNAYSAAVDLGMQLYAFQKDPVWLEKVFGYMEENKSSVLQADMGVPEPDLADPHTRDMLHEERRLQATVTQLNIRLSSTGDSQAYDRIRDNMRDLEIRISGLQERLEDSPEYYRLKFNAGGIHIAEIRDKLLPDHTALLSYYYAKERLYCFYITGDEFGCLVTALPRQFKEHILALRKELDAGETGDNSRAGEIIRELSGQLIAPVYEKIKGQRRLIVIPYNEIGYIPFEILQTPETAPIGLPGHPVRLLINDFAISYTYSANFLTRPFPAPTGRYRVLAMAPFSGSGTSASTGSGTSASTGSGTSVSTGSGNASGSGASAEGSEFPPLRSSRWEVEDCKGKVLLDKEATKENFIGLLSKYPVIHLATHAVVNDANPLGSFIEFYNPGGKTADTAHRLYEQEIVHLPMDSTALVLLSACETGNGQLINGEGIISLSRAFSYAGCGSVITSLWKADDSSTAYIARRVHHYLQAGEPKDEALRKAKLDYLDDDGIDARYKLPAYWAPLVLVGDTQAVTESSGVWTLIIRVVFLAVFAQLFAMVYARFKKKPGTDKGVRTR
jgi:CHAT domain-containing protein